MKTKLILCPLVKVFRRGQIVCLFHPYSLERVYIDNATFRTLQKSAEKLDAEMVSDLLERGILVDSTFKKTEFIESFASKYLYNKPQITICYLMHTTFCNFACKYCYVATHKLPIQLMDMKVAKWGIDVFLKHTELVHEDDPRKLIHFGGEPLINFPVLKAITLYAKEQFYRQGIELETVVVTNASLINEKMADFFHRNDVWVNVSIDGPQDIHDKMRIGLNGRGTFKETKRGLDLLKKYNCNILITCTVGVHNIENLPQIIEYFFNELNVEGVKLNPVSGFLSQGELQEVPPHLLFKKMLEAFKVARDLGLYEDTFMKPIKAFVEQRFNIRGCGAVGNQIVVWPNGNVTPCHAIQQSPNYVSIATKTIDLTRDPIFLEWNRRVPLMFHECQKCKAIGICGGGCPYRAFIKNNTIWSIDERWCLLSRKLLEWLIWDLYGAISKK